MSLDIVRKNSSSPFHLQRSIVEQDSEGGAYESGGFNPNMVYNNDAANSAIESLGKVVGAGLSSRTAGDKNKADENKVKRLQDRGARVYEKSKSANPEKQAKLENRVNRITSKIESTNKDISKYKESLNPSLKSTLVTDLNKGTLEEKAGGKDYNNAFKVKDKIIDYKPIKLKQNIRFYS